MQITMYAHISKESLIEKGIEAGLSEDAVNVFKFFNEVGPLYLDVADDGMVQSCKTAAHKELEAENERLKAEIEYMKETFVER